jgi:superfamily II DNA or RNA helicase
MATGALVAGARIRVRDAEWVVAHVERNAASGAIVHATGISGIVSDKEAIFVEAIENTRGHGIEVVDPADVVLVADPSSGFADVLLHLEAALRKSAPTGQAVQVAGKAAIDDLDFQLDPVRLALKTPRVRILIGDDVGLGKTLEAGLLASELILRRRARRILVVTTKAMLTQFQQEFWTRFSIPLVRIDSAKIQQVRAQIPLNHNPFDQFDRAIISIDTLKNDLQYRTALEKSWWDLIIIDEAHNVAERRGTGGGISQRSQLADRLSTRSDALVLLSATPHDGSRQSFASLMRMLDPTSIADPEDYGPDDIKGLFLRRFRTTPAVKVALKGKVKRRVTKRIAFTPSQAEEAAYDILARLNLHEDVEVHKKGQRLFKTLLEKALFSSPAACAETIEKRVKKLESDQAPASKQDASALRELLSAVLAIDTEAFSKYRHIRALFTELKWSPKKKDDRIVIFSERIATLEWLAVRLREDLGLSEEQVKTLHASGVGADVKTNKIVEDFGIEKKPIRILLASDMASEGLNLHYLSNKLIHFDIPWALLKFQQRNGRIDRYGQERQPHIWYLVAQPAQPKIRGDLRILDRLIDKDEAAQENIGDPSAFLGTNDEQEQEDVVAEAIEAGKSAEAFEAEMDDRAAETASSAVDHYAALEAFFEAAQTAPAAPAGVTEKTSRPSVFEDTFAYAVTALTRVKAWKPDIHFDVDRKDRVVTLSIPDDFRERSDFGAQATRTVDPRFMPPEAEPAEGRIKLTDNRQLMSERIRAARQGTGHGWPHFQYLWDVHPAIDWLSDKISGVFGRRQAPVARIAGILQKDEVAFVFNGIVPNLKGQPLVDEWPVVVFSKSRFVRVETIRDLLNRTGIGQIELPNVGATQVDDLRPLVAEAVNRAQTFVHETRRSFQKDMDGELLLLDERLEALRTKHRRRIADLFDHLGDSALHQGRRKQRETKIEETFDAWWDWIKKTRETPNDPNPYVRLVAVFRG